MRFHTYSKFSPEAADAVDLQALLDNLADFLLQSGFAGGQNYNPYWDEPQEGEGAVQGADFRVAGDDREFVAAPGQGASGPWS